LLKLSFACGPYDRMEALQYNRIEVEGIDLKYLEIQSPREIFDRMVGEMAFDLSELSLSEHVVMTSRGNSPFVALPVFPSKAFRHGFITISKKSGIKEPKDLAGKRISNVQWVQGAVEKAGSHGKPPAVPDLLQPVDITQNSSDKSLSEMLRDGEIDALIGSRLPASLRTDSDKVTRLFPNPREEEKRYYLEHKIHPIMHTVAIQRKVYEDNKWIASSLFKAFLEARNCAIEKMYFSAAQRYMLPWLYDDLHEIDDVFGKDLWAYGVDQNRSTLEAFVKYMKQQHFIENELPIDDLFVPIERLRDQ